MIVARFKKNVVMFYHIHFCIISVGKFGPTYLGKATAAARAALPNPTSECWVFSCFGNPHKSDMDYRILIIMRTWSYHSHACVYTRELGTSTGSQHDILDSGKTITNGFLCSWWGWNLGSLDL